MGPVSRWDASPRRGRRNQLLLAGAVPSAAALVAASVLGSLLVRNDLGTAAYDRGDHETAQAHFAANRWLGVLDPWIAPLNEGDAHYRLEEYAAAVDDFAASLRDAPADWVCPIRLNLALAWEHVGDERAAAGDTGERGRDDGSAAREAEDAWRTGRAALADARCTELVDDPEVGWQRSAALQTDARLDEKVTASVERTVEELDASLTPEQRRRQRELERQQERAREREARLRDRERQEENGPRQDDQDAERGGKEEETPAPGSPGAPGTGETYEW